VRHLIVVRHAKASHGEHATTDYERPLSARGRRECEQLRAWARDGASRGGYGPTIALVSAAARTRETFQRAFADTDFVTSWHVTDAIYNGHREVTADDLLIELAAIDPGDQSLLVVGHNPTVHELVESVASEVPEVLRRRGYPPAAAFVFALRDGQPLGRDRCSLVAQFVPDVGPPRQPGP
jgi:phosphohistidine phosphatase